MVVFCYFVLQVQFASSEDTYLTAVVIVTFQIKKISKLIKYIALLKSLLVLKQGWEDIRFYHRSP